MNFTLPQLPYLPQELSGFLSEETFAYHYGKHHQTYVNNLNNLIVGTEYENLSLEEIIVKSVSGPIFNNAAQVWNHTFYFESLTGNKQEISKNLNDLIISSFGNYENFVELFSKSALTNFGSGWTWLVLKDGKLEIVNTSNAGCVLTIAGAKPLLTIDVWEHAYYIDFRNNRAEYIKKFFDYINWDKVSERL